MPATLKSEVSMPHGLASHQVALTEAEQQGLLRLVARGLLVSPATPEAIRLPVIPSMKGQAQSLLDAVRGDD